MALLSDPIQITSSVLIPRREISFVVSRSAGPGGQNVNKVSSRVSLIFDVGGSASLSPGQQQRIRQRLATRMTRAGVLRVSCQVHRSQAANRRAVVERFAALLARALARPRRRVSTRVSLAQKRRRLETKRRQAQRKRDRRDVPADD